MLKVSVKQKGYQVSDGVARKKGQLMTRKEMDRNNIRENGSI